MVKDIFDIRDDYAIGRYDSDIEVPRKVSENHIFDADLSVNKNKEMVKEHNANVDRLREERAKENKALRETMIKEIIAYIVETYHFSEKKAKIIFDTAVDESDEFEESFELIEKMCDLVERLNEITD